MGTNYYLIYNLCPHCSRSNELHLGKSSHGWKFTFQTIENLKLKDIDPAHMIADSEEEITVESYKDLKKFLKLYVDDLKVAKIRDEYGDYFTLEEFLEMVDKKFKTEKLSHYDEVTKDHSWGNERELKDSKGHSFSRSDFS